MTTPSKADVLRIAGEPVARLLVWDGPAYMVPHGGTAARTFAEFPKSAEQGGYWKDGPGMLYTEAQLLAIYAASAEDMRERAANTLKLSSADLLLMAGEMSAQELRTVHAVLSALENSIRTLPITPDGENYDHPKQR